VIPGLESILEGKVKDDHVLITVSPEDGYGIRDEELVQAFPKRQFEDPDALEVGMQFELQSDEDPTIVSIVGIEEDQILVDGNHPLAGMTLTFDVTVREVRLPTKEELSHGHVHGPGGHHH
jgi:FKBP-type peptidyl-prolyl cis-trans isomerase SlyD